MLHLPEIHFRRLIADLQVCVFSEKGDISYGIHLRPLVALLIQEGAREDVMNL